MQVHVISDVARRGQGAWERLLDALSERPPDLLQIREKGSSDRDVLRLATQAVARLGARTDVLVNGRPDLALCAGAQGVQLPSDGLPPAAVRLAFPTLRLGVSCHSVPEVLATSRLPAEGSRVDHVVLAPVYTPTSKPAVGLPLGPEALDDLPEPPLVPVHALGGLTHERVAAWPLSRRRRIHAVSGIGLFWDATDLARVVAELQALPGAA